MRVFVTGVAGQLGHDCMNELVKRGHEAVGSDVVHVAAPHSGANEPTLIARMDYVQLDITDQAAVAATIVKIKPDAIIHCAAWTAVDAAEDEENKAKVHAINVDGTRYITEAAKACLL
jgi:dTDP-4-dehydrorhamnose reductase